MQIIGEDYFVRILDREQFLEAADSVFNPDFRETIANAPLDEFGVTIYGMTVCDHRIAFISYLINADESLFGVSMISLSAPIWPTFAYAFLDPAPTPQP